MILFWSTSRFLSHALEVSSRSRTIDQLPTCGHVLCVFPIPDGIIFHTSFLRQMRALTCRIYYSDDPSPIHASEKQMARSWLFEQCRPSLPPDFEIFLFVYSDNSVGLWPYFPVNYCCNIKTSSTQICQTLHVENWNPYKAGPKSLRIW